MQAEIVELAGCPVIASRIETPDGPLLSRFVLEDLGDACHLIHSLAAEIRVITGGSPPYSSRPG